MLKSELLRIQRLAKQNKEKAARDLAEEEKKRDNPRVQEKKKLRKDDEAADANRLFKEMKERDF